MAEMKLSRSAEGLPITRVSRGEDISADVAVFRSKTTSRMALRYVRRDGYRGNGSMVSRRLGEDAAPEARAALSLRKT